MFSVLTDLKLGMVFLTNSAGVDDVKINCLWPFCLFN